MLESSTEHTIKAVVVQKDEAMANPWIQYGGLLIHQGFFGKGLVVVKPKHIPPLTNTKDNSFLITDREFFVYGPTQGANSNNAESRLPSSRHVKRTKILLSKLAAFAHSTIPDTCPIFFNKRHRDEIFLPFILNNQQGQKTGIHVYPWCSSYNANFEFTGFTQFVTAGCLFGQTLKGIDQHGASFTLIKHNIEFFPGQRIELIKHNPDAANPYELTLLYELENLTSLIDILYKSGQPKRLLYHLPYYDYMLFGIKLFIQGRITSNALDMLFKVILIKKDTFIEKIRKICDSKKIEVVVASPFDNIFEDMHIESSNAKVILSALGLSCDEVNPDNINERKQQEKDFVERCLHKLQNNTFKEEHRKAWKSFGNVDRDKISSIEDLLSVANAIMVAVASSGKKDYETCALGPLSEKQILVNFINKSNKLTNDAKKTNQYPKVFNITTLDPVIAYSPSQATTPGLLFYFDTCRSELSRLILEKKLLSYACENVGIFSQIKKHVELQKNIELSSLQNVKLEQKEVTHSLQQVLSSLH